MLENPEGKDGFFEFVNIQIADLEVRVEAAKSELNALTKKWNTAITNRSDKEDTIAAEMSALDTYSEKETARTALVLALDNCNENNREAREGIKDSRQRFMRE